MKKRRSLTTRPQRRNAPKAVRRRGPAAAGLNKKVALLKRERDEALEQQAATAEVLRVISSSPGELGPVFEAMLANAVRICEANFGVLFRFNGDAAAAAAMFGVPPAFAEFWQRGPQRPGRQTALGRVLETQQMVHIVDVMEDPAYKGGEAVFVAAVQLGGFRTLINVPLLKENELVGTIAIYRQEVRPFTDKQIELVQNFANQAVIAIENTRLLNELRQRTDDLSEALEQQTATSEVLKVISSSPGDLEPVFDAMLENATRICQANFGAMYLYEDGAFRVAAMHNVPPAFAEARRRGPLIRPSPSNPMVRVAATKRPLQIRDVPEDPAWPRDDAQFGVFASLTGARCLITVPMLKEGQVIGVIGIYRLEVLPFNEKQIALLANFAAQAVIAIENTRLLKELRQRTDDLSESLQQQTATADVLKVISSSPGELEPVFQAMLENATRLCAAKFGNLYLCEGDAFRMTAMYNAPPAFAEARRRDPLVRPGPGSMLGRVARSKSAVHIPDATADEGYIKRNPMFVTAVELGGFRALLAVPMLKDGNLIGAITIYRQDAGTFTDKQIDLVQNFAAQAVIAIENTRLLKELRQRTDDLSEALEQQTATSEVLKVISSSPGELEPVFDAMLDNATRLCEAKFGVLLLWEEGAFRTVALHNAPPAFAEQRRFEPVIHPTPVNPLGRLVATKQVEHVADMRAEKAYRDGEPGPVSLVELAGARTVINVPMLKENELIGCISFYRQEVRPFTDKQVELLTNFAAQAVIAIENTRLLKELRQRTDDLSESLEQQTATSEVLQVISKSPGELQPVFEALLANATRLCEASYGAMWLCEGGAFRTAALHGDLPAAYLEQWRSGTLIRPGPNTPMARVAKTRQPVLVPDMRTDPSYLEGGPLPVSAVEVAGIRTLFSVPMLRENDVVGAITIYRTEVQPFSDKQIQLLTNFAAQAVIAIENTRLLSELRESLQQQTATADVLKVISRSTFDLQTVLNTLTESAARLCRAERSAIRLAKDGLYHHAASHGFLPEHEKRMQREPVKPGRGSIVGRVVIDGKSVHLLDSQSDPDPEVANRSRSGNVRTMLGVPLQREGTPIGVLLLQRSIVQPFTDKEISLAETFADQAVIAIENVRLFDAEQQRTRELSESLEQQTATSEVLKVISTSPGELEPVFQTMLENATRICGAKFGVLHRYENSAFRPAAWVGVPQPLAEYYRQLGSFQPPAGSPLDRLLQAGGAIYTADETAESNSSPARLGGARSLVAVPMRKDNELVGAIVIYRQEVLPFSNKQVALLTNFAAQAVIAIENTRLLTELRQRTDDLSESLEQQTATSEVLRVISSSPGDLEPVFQAMLKNAVQICGAKFGNLWLREGDAFRIGATHDAPPAYVDFLRSEPVFYPDPKLNLGQMVRSKKAFQTADVAAVTEHRDKMRQALIDLAGARTLIGVPMLKDNEVIGAIGIYRQEVRPFTDKQIELVKNFAAQAVIAIENTRLLKELRQRTDDLSESLEQQTATSEVLKVISSSPGELKPVFQAMLANATRICEATFGHLWLFEGNAFRAVAIHSKQSFADYLSHNPVIDLRDNPGIPLDRLANTKQLVHIPDLEADQSYIEKNSRVMPLVEVAGVRTFVLVPMLKEGELIGAIAMYRQEVRPFSDKQIDLVQNFAAQAVIAIENARLLNELRQRTDDLTESLEQQMATSEVLKVISSSPGELEPVFRAMLENTLRICEARFGQMFLWQNDAVRLVAHIGVPAALAEFDEGRGAFQPVPGGPLDFVLRARQVIHVSDMLSKYAEHPPVKLGGARSYIAVPMLKEGELIGAICIYRTAVQPFTDKQIELVQNFAAQAVIAIENTRLLNELRQRTDDLSESLEQQTATGEILASISGSLTDTKPVFDAIVRSLLRLFGTRHAVVQLLHDGIIYMSAIDGEPGLEKLIKHYPRPLDDRTIGGLAMLSKQMVQFAPVVGNPAAPAATQEFAREFGFDSALFAPMMRGENVIGAIGVADREPKVFNDKQVALIKSFADQAVIAIENVRLFDDVQKRTRELSEALKQQTATADVLKVISRSTFDLKTVLDALVEAAARLCEADQGTIARERDGVYQRVATYGFSAEFTEYVRTLPVIPERGTATGRALLEGKVVHIPDVQADPEYTFVEAQKLGEFRTILSVPMLREGAPIGVLALTRHEVRPFTDKQIELVSTFADQAAIAIENVRLFESVEARTRELAKSLEELRTAQDRLIQTEKLASLGQLTAGIAHEIKNPLNFVNNFSAISVELIDELREALAGANLDNKLRAQINEIADMLQGNLDKVVQHGKRADSIVKNMLLHSRQGSGEHRPIEINAVVEESLNLAYHGARAEKQGFNITLERSFDPAAGEVDLFPQEITRVLLNLISNGFYAATKRKAEANGGNYEPTLAAATRNLGDSVEIRIRDNGTGIPPEVKERMFNPFFTTKPVGEGTGLGLSLSYDIIVKQHAGSIEVDTQPGEFTEFRIVLPRGAATIAKAGERT